jgi:CHAT domain-containing protein
MKLLLSWFNVSLSISLFLIFASPGNTQSGNMSDVTQPNPQEMPRVGRPENPGAGGRSTNPGRNLPTGQNPDNLPRSTENLNSGGGNSPTSPTNGGTTSGGTTSGGTTSGGTTSGGTTGGGTTGGGTTGGGTTGGGTTGGGTTGGGTTNSNSQNNTSSSNNSSSENENNTSTEENQQETAQERAVREQAQQREAQQREAQQREAQRREEEKKQAESQSQAQQSNVQVDRQAYDAQLQEAAPVQAVQLQEEFQAVEMQNYLGVELFGDSPPPEEIATSLSELNRETGKKSALIYVSAIDNEIITFAVLPEDSQTASNVKGRSRQKLVAVSSSPTILKRTPVSREKLLATVKQFQEGISDEFRVGDRDYLKYSQQLYQWIVAPIEAQLQAQGIDILVFTMDSGLRGLPLAALNDGKQFLIEKYAVALVPSFGLTDIRYVDVRKRPILAMGASQFKDKFPLPAVPIELQTAIENPRRGQKFLNAQFTIANFRNQNEKERFAIIHLGTHAEFQPGDKNQSYIEFSDNRLSMSQLVQLSDELGWSSADDSPVELLVLSACQTALGDRQAELGFAGLAVAAGVKSVLASLWNVSDLGTLGLMSQFYNEYDLQANKSEALRQAQLAMLKGQLQVNNGVMTLSNGEKIALPPEFPQGKLDLSHPYYWASFTLIGNWN